MLFIIGELWVDAISSWWTVDECCSLLVDSGWILALDACDGATRAEPRKEKRL